MLAKAGDLVVRTWRTYRALFPAAPLLFLAPLLVYELLGAAMTPVLGPQGDVGPAVVLTLGIAGLTMLLVLALAYVAGIVIKEADALDGDRPRDLLRTGRDLRRRGDDLARGALLATVGLVVGTALLVVPGVILFLAWFLALPVLVHEFRGPREALGRSNRLMDGRRGIVAAVAFPLLVGSLGLAGIATVVADWNPWVGAILGAGLGALVLPYWTLLMATAYRDVVPHMSGNLPKNPLERPTKHRYACPRCEREYLLPELPRPGTACPSCRRQVEGNA